MTRTAKWISAALCIWAIALANVAGANTTQYWTQAGLERFYHGDFFGTALTQDGRVTLGMAMDEVYKSTEPYLWSMAYDNRGNLWMGSGNKAILYKIMKVGEPEEVAVLPGMGITAIAVDGKNNIYAAVMPGGKIFKIDYKGDKKEYAALSATYVWDMEFGKNGNLFCVTGGGAGAYEVTSEGRIIPLYNSGEAHFLSMFLDGKGNLYTGTSPGGLILKINIGEAEKMAGAGAPPPAANTGGWTHPPKGDSDEQPATESIETMEVVTAEAEIDFEPDDGENENGESHGMSKAPVAPTDPRVTVLLDLEEDEAYRLLLLPDGNFLVAANRNQNAPPNPQNPVATSSNGQPLSFPIGNKPAAGKQGMPAIPARAYLVTPEGRSRLVLEVPDPYIMSMNSMGGNDVIVGTGDSGRLYTLNVETGEAMLQSIPVKHILAITGSGDDLRLATGNPGSVFKPAGVVEKSGQYMSSINDAGTTAFYGNMDAVADLPEGAALEFQTRTGNTPDPMDGTWSEWSAAKSAWPFSIESPSGRYIQYMATLYRASSGDGAPRLSEARVYYITDNQSPEILKVKVKPQPRVVAPPANVQNNNQQGPPSPPPQNNGSQGPAEKNMVVGTITVSDQISFHWEAKDPDSDNLRFIIEIRKLPESGWVLVDEYAYGEEYKWQTDSIPDGTYEARITVTDEDSNPPERALTDEGISDPFIIDHTRPTITVDKVDKNKDGGYTITARVTDPTSIVSGVEYSLNDLEWHMVFPKDMIFDSKEEPVSFTIDSPDEGENTVLIRARDFVGNTGSVSVPLSK